jgi:predicted nucleotide-binding protein
MGRSESDVTRDGYERRENSKGIIMKPKVVIYSAQEDEEIARAIQENIEHCADVAVWTQGVIGPSQTIIDALATSARRYDFAIFLFTPVDRLSIRDEMYFVPRDNVVFESGLFLGRLGLERTFLVTPSTRGMGLGLPFRILTDLHGFVRVNYNPSSANLIAALGAACSKIEREINRLGVLRQEVSIINKKSGKSLDVDGWGNDDGTPIIQFTFHGSENQRWLLFRADESRFKIMSKHSGKFLDLPGQSTKSGAIVHQWIGHDGASQSWLIEPTSSGAFKIMSLHSKKFVSVEGGSSDDRARIIQANWRDDDSFRWWVNATFSLP